MKPSVAVRVLFGVLTCFSATLRAFSPLLKAHGAQRARRRSNSLLPLPLDQFRQWLASPTALTTVSTSVSTTGVSKSASDSSSSSSTTSTLSINQRALADMPPFPRTWVPLASTFELNPDRPNRLEFMGQSYVAYRTNDNGPWVVLDNTCSHRLAPLDEGRVDRKNNVLECAYHGWAFDADGKCQRIPQADEATTRAALNNPRCNVNSYPVIVEKSMLFAWLWPEDPLSTLLEDDGSSKGVDSLNDHMPLAAQPEQMLQGVLPNCSTYTRDLPYGWDIVLENIADPAHVPWAHHGLQGKREDATVINMTAPVVSKGGFRFEFSDRTMGLRRMGHCDFRAPYVMQYEAEFEQTSPDTPPKVFNLTAVMIPTRPGWSRIMLFGGQTRKENQQREKEAKKAKSKFNLMRFLFSVMPTWMVHQLSNKFLDSDLAFLHYQEQERQRRETMSDSDMPYFIPAQSDRCVSALRQWMKQYAFTPGPLPPAIYDRTLLFDRWAQHTDQCRHCTKAAEGIKRWKSNTYRILAASVLLIKFLAARVSIVACLLMLRLLSAIEPSFRKGEFKHYENH